MEEIDGIESFKQAEVKDTKQTEDPEMDRTVKKEKKLKEKRIKIGGIIYTIKGDKATVRKVKTKKRKVKIPDSIMYKSKRYSVTRIGRKAFSGNKYVKKIILGKSIRSIGKEAFTGCRSLKKVVLRM